MKIVRGNYLIFNNNLPVEEKKPEALNEAVTRKAKLTCECYVIIPEHNRREYKVSSYVRIIRKHFTKLSEKWKSGIRVSSFVLTGEWNNVQETETVEDYTIDIVTANPDEVTGFLSPKRVDFGVSFPTEKPDWRMLYEFTTFITELTEIFGFSQYTEIYNKLDPDNNLQIRHNDISFMSSGNVSMDQMKRVYKFIIGADNEKHTDNQYIYHNTTKELPWYSQHILHSCGAIDNINEPPVRIREDEATKSVELCIRKYDTVTSREIQKIYNGYREYVYPDIGFEIILIIDGTLKLNTGKMPFMTDVTLRMSRGNIEETPGSITKEEFLELAKK